jgi:hypothetical protein
MHDRCIAEFTTGERLELSKWWFGSGMPRLLVHVKEGGGLIHYCTSSAYDPDEYMISWRVKDAPIFTLVYRGKEVDALKGRRRMLESDDRSRTVMFSHATGECYIVSPDMHLQEGDPPLIVQYVQDTYLRREGEGYVDLLPLEIGERFGSSNNNITGMDARTGEAVCGDEKVVLTSLKVVDCIIDEAASAKERVAVMQNIERKWSMSVTSTRRRGVMWCGEVHNNVDGILQMIELRQTLKHCMEAVVLLTNDPFVQIHFTSLDTVYMELQNYKEMRSMRKKKRSFIVSPPLPGPSPTSTLLGNHAHLYSHLQPPLPPSQNPPALDAAGREPYMTCTLIRPEMEPDHLLRGSLIPGSDVLISSAQPSEDYHRSSSDHHQKSLRKRRQKKGAASLSLFVQW